MEYVGKIIYDEKLFENRKYIIYGFGEHGKKIYEYMKKIGRENNVIGFCDKKAKSIVEAKYLVLLPEEAIENTNIDFLVGGKYEYEMVQFLLKHKISKIHMLSI